MVPITIDHLKIAFRKLLTYTYFDKNDMALRRNVAEFAKKVTDTQVAEQMFSELLQVANGDNVAQLESLLSKMRLMYYPKKVTGIKEQQDNAEHVITNKPAPSAQADRILVRANVPTELLILDIAWVMRYAYKSDFALDDNMCWGNRLDLLPNGSGIKKGNALFKWYPKQYREWWEQGIKMANAQLTNGNDITIINFDIQNCYHSIDLDFPSYLQQYENQNPNMPISEDTLTGVIRRIYERYWQLTATSGADIYLGENQGKHPLCLSLISSHILANWHLQPLEQYISEHYHPLYFGRYVDDCMVVLLTPPNVEDNLGNIDVEMPGLFETHDDESMTFAIANDDVNNNPIRRLKDFTIQKEKLYVYHFDCELPQSSIDKYVQDQKERSSEFRFLTDESDQNAMGLELVTLVNALDANEESGRRFDILESNQYRLSVYLAKLNSRLAVYPDDEKYQKEANKVAHYFQGHLLIKHYLLWEKLLTLFVLAGQQENLLHMKDNISEQISKITAKNGLFVEEETGQGLTTIKTTLLQHLKESFLMARSLHRGEGYFSTIYLDTYMVRMHYNTYSLQEFTAEFKKEGVRLSQQSFRLRNRWWKYPWIPYFVRYYDIVIAMSLGMPYDPHVFEKAYHHYMSANHVGNDFDWTYFCHLVRGKEMGGEFNTGSSRNPDDKDELTVAVIEMDLDKQALDRVIDDPYDGKAEKLKIMQTILDKIEAIEKTDIFIMPELSLPAFSLRSFCQRSANRNIAFVSGMEYYKKGNKVYNHIVTCLPITLYGQRDAVPVIRLKNYYAPVENENIERTRQLTVPHNSQPWQLLYHWRGHLFTTYYCYELASIKHRSYFYSVVDAIYSPVYNKDTYYYNNIVESCVRDMHCYVILDNVSHYGDARVSQPTSHVTMNMLRVKGGNTADNKVVVLTAEINIKDLRDFQELTEEVQGDKKHFPYPYKQTPPDFDKTKLQARHIGRFIYPYSNDIEEFMAQFVRDSIEY